jgi:putative two-component system response regulator
VRYYIWRGEIMRIALIDNSRAALAMIRSCVETLPNLEVIEFQSPRKALTDASFTQFDFVLTDYEMRAMNGIEFIRLLRELPSYRDVPIIMLTSIDDQDVCIEALQAGATDFIRKPFRSVELARRIENLLALRNAQLHLQDRARMLGGAVELAKHALVNREEEIIWRLARAIEARDGATGEHVTRVAKISFLIAQSMGLPETRCRTIYMAAPLHDVGKIGIPDSILTKPGRLTAEEITVMRRHVDIGVKILENGTSDLLRVAEIIAGGHHERWDGTGYPKGLSKLEIPLEARIAAVADVFDAMCTNRSYKLAWPIEDAKREIILGSDKLYDPQCVTAFENCWPQIATLYSEMQSESPEEHKP